LHGDEGDHTLQDSERPEVSREGLDDGPGLGTARNDMSGRAENVVQIGRARDVHVSLETQGPRVASWQVPGEEPGFVNRVAELEEMGSALPSPSAPLALILLLLGPSGVGKSALSRRFAAAYRTRFRHGYHVSLTEFRGAGGAVDLGAVFGALLLGMGVAHAAIPPTLPARESMYRALIADREALVLVDDAELARQVTALAPGGRGALVVTSQRRLAELRGTGTMTVEVGRLSAADGTALIAEQIGTARAEAEPGAVVNLVELCDGLPVLLRAVCAHLVARPRRPLSVSASQLRDARERARDFDRAGAFAVLDVMAAELPENAARLYRTLGMMPGTEMGTAAVGVAAGVSEVEAASGLDELVEAGLLEEIDSDRFAVHSMIRAHAAHSSVQAYGEAERSALLLRIVEWYLACGQAADRAAAPVRTRLPGPSVTAPAGYSAPTFDDDRAALAWLEAEHASLLGCVRIAAEHQWNELVWLGCDPLWALNQAFRHPAAWIEALTLAIEAAERAGRRWVNARLRCLLSRAYVDLAEFDSAARSLDSALESARLEGDRQLEASVLEFTGIVELEAGRPGAALELFAAGRRVIAAAEQTPDARRADVILRYLTGRALTDDGQLESGARILEDVYPEAGESDARLTGMVRFALIEALLELGRPGSVRELAALAASEAVRRGVPVEQVRALRLLARAHQDCGEPEEAVRCQAEADRVHSGLGLDGWTDAGS